MVRLLVVLDGASFLAMGGDGLVVWTWWTRQVALLQGGYTQVFYEREVMGCDGKEQCGTGEQGPARRIAARSVLTDCAGGHEA